MGNGQDEKLQLRAADLEDLSVIAGLVQDALVALCDVTYLNEDKAFILVLNRFRWEDRDNAEKRRRDVERVQSVLVIDNVLKVASQGVDRSDKETILSVLSLEFEATDESAGNLTLTLAGDGALRLTVEALEVSLRDVTRPYIAPSKQVPDHET